jgi:hypothetical protein
VRLKSDDGAPQKEIWSISTNGMALFNSRPMDFVKQLEDTKVFLFEFTPFQKTATTVRFNVSGLSEKLMAISETCGLAEKV